MVVNAYFGNKIDEQIQVYSSKVASRCQCQEAQETCREVLLRLMKCASCPRISVPHTNVTRY